MPAVPGGVCSWERGRLGRTCNPTGKNCEVIRWDGVVFTLFSAQRAQSPGYVFIKAGMNLPKAAESLQMAILFGSTAGVADERANTVTRYISSALAARKCWGRSGCNCWRRESRPDFWNPHNLVLTQLLTLPGPVPMEKCIVIAFPVMRVAVRRLRQA